MQCSISLLTSPELPKLNKYTTLRLNSNKHSIVNNKIILNIDFRNANFLPVFFESCNFENCIFDLKNIDLLVFDENNTFKNCIIIDNRNYLLEYDVSTIHNFYHNNNFINVTWI
jgi:uncharacterized protein YjbI with pentapeptide repeats